MLIRKAKAVWENNLKEGNGVYYLESGSCQGAYSFSTRFEDEPGSNPEELLGAAHAACFSMAFAHELFEAGFVAQVVETEAVIQLNKLDDGFKIESSTLNAKVQVSSGSPDEIQKIAELAKKNCPVSQALQGLSIKLNLKIIK